MGRRTKKNESILCADIGGSRVKAAVMHSGISLEELQAVRTIAFDSKEWLNENLPMLFHSSSVESLCHKVSTSFDQICFGVKGPVMDGSLFVVSQVSLPREIKRECEETSQCSVFVECDMGIWSRGALYWQNLVKQEIPYPCLGVTFGTGIGVALLRSPHDVVNIEISVLDAPFERLLELAVDQPLNIEYARLTPHGPIGKPFFQWVKYAYPHYDDQMVQKEFNRRVKAFLEDMEEFFDKKLGISINSVMMGGGNSRFIEALTLQKEIGKKIMVLSPQSLARFGVSPDIISLLGCTLLPHHSPVEMIPSWDEMMPWYK